MNNKKLNVALVGLGFGGAFAGIYKEHPDVGELTLFDTDRQKAEKVSEHIGGAKIAESFAAILADKSIDAAVAFGQHLVLEAAASAEHAVALGVLGQEALAVGLGGLALLGGFGLLQLFHFGEEAVEDGVHVAFRHFGLATGKEVAHGHCKIVDIEACLKSHFEQLTAYVVAQSIA